MRVRTITCGWRGTEVWFLLTHIISDVSSEKRLEKNKPALTHTAWLHVSLDFPPQIFIFVSDNGSIHVAKSAALWDGDRLVALFFFCLSLKTFSLFLHVLIRMRVSAAGQGLHMWNGFITFFIQNQRRLQPEFAAADHSEALLSVPFPPLCGL